MPHINGKVLTALELIAMDRCPETGIELAGVNIEQHIARTWVAKPAADPSGDEPRHRMQMLRDWAKTHAHLHPKYDEDGNLIEEAR